MTERYNVKTMSVAVSIHVAKNLKMCCTFLAQKRGFVRALYGCVELINKTLYEYWAERWFYFEIAYVFNIAYISTTPQLLY